MQDASASICVTKIILKALYGGLSPACSCWGPDDKKNISGSWLIEYYSHLSTPLAACCLEAIPPKLMLTA